RAPVPTFVSFCSKCPYELDHRAVEDFRLLPLRAVAGIRDDNHLAVRGLLPDLPQQIGPDPEVCIAGYEQGRHLEGGERRPGELVPQPDRARGPGPNVPLLHLRSAHWTAG